MINRAAQPLYLCDLLSVPRSRESAAPRQYSARRVDETRRPPSSVVPYPLGPSPFWMDAA